MSNKTTALRFALLFAASLGLLLWTSAVQAQTAQYKLTGNSRIQIGGGLPVPITGAPPPDGRIEAHAAALAAQTTGADPVEMQLASGQLQAPGNTLNIGVFANNPNVFQVQTRIPIKGGGGTFEAGGRTGAATTTFTPGAVPGNMVYRSLANQFGGVAQGTGAGGTAIVAINAGGNNPAGGDCTNLATNACTVVFAFANVADTGAHGGAFGFFNTTQPPIPGPASGGIAATVSPGGIVGAYVNLGISGLPNTATSYGGPWTTGQIVISQPAATPAEVFTITGSDSRVNGEGSISLVAGTVSDRSLSGPNANRGWLNLNVTELPEPTAALGAAGALAVLALCHGLVRRRSR